MKQLDVIKVTAKIAEGAIYLCYSSMYSSKTPNVPLVLNVLIDHPCNAHGHDSIVPRGDEHQSQTHAHAQEGQCPIGETCLRLYLCSYKN